MANTPEQTISRSGYADKTGHWARHQFGLVIQENPNLSRGQVEINTSNIPNRTVVYPKDGKR